MTDQQHRWIWTEQGVDAQGLRGPDGKWLLKLPSGHEDLWSAPIERAWADLSAPTLVNTTDNNQSRPDALVAAGFVARRTEELWHITMAAAAGRTVAATFHRLVPLQCNLARVVELENAVRSDIPDTQGGAAAWWSLRRRWPMTSSTRSCT